MRQLKFRVWSPELKTFVTRENYLHFRENEVAFNDDYMSDFGHFFESLEDVIELGYTIQQFTGLKDENQKEIYEGDFIRIKYHCSLKQTPFSDEIIKVEWNQDGCRFNIANVSDAKFWVVGNIFENTELIK